MDENKEKKEIKTENRLLGNKLFLYVTEFISGVSVMAVELGASRLLAPYFSSSQIVWTIIIGMIMIAMALGNVYGGRVADKNPDPALLYRRIMIAAVWFAAVPFFGRFIIIGISALLVFSVSTNFLIIAAFLSCAVLFVFPLFLLGTVTPSLVRFTVSDLNESGKVVGRLGACNTVGSIIGTFLPTFVTIPSIGTSYSFLLFSGLLLGVACVYYFFSGKTKKYIAAAISLALFVLCALLSGKTSLAFWKSDKVYEGESVYNYLLVSEDKNRITLSTNVLFGVQSIKMKDGGLTDMYYDYALAAPVMTGKTEDLSVLVLGGGTGTYASQCLRYFDVSKVENVEIDEKISYLAREYFSMPDEVKVIDYDGRAYLAAVKDKYDVIFVDAYQDITIPFQMSTLEFFTLVKEHLSVGGVMAVNMNMRSESGGINTYLCDTICRVFGHVSLADVKNGSNRVLFASGEEEPEALLKRGLENVSDPDLSAFLSGLPESLEVCSGGPNVLTDDKAPVELLGMEAIDGMISDELAYYKRIYEREGFRGLLKSLGIG